MSNYSMYRVSKQSLSWVWEVILRCLIDGDLLKNWTVKLISIMIFKIKYFLLHRIELITRNKELKGTALRK